jgi:iron complex transport system ATP-binding protein
MSAPAVTAQNVRYATRGKALIDDVSLTLAGGQLTTVIGPNGAGKSTLLRVLAGELVCSAGTVRYGSEDARTLPPWRLAARRAVMAQTTRLAFPFSVREVAALGIDGIGRGLTRERRRAVVATALEKAEVAHLADRIYQTLSGGEQQRVQFARALVQLSAGREASADQVLFLDEPTSHLDMSHQLQLMDEVRSLAASGVATFVTIHDLNLAAAYADHLVVMRGGRAVAQGKPHEILTTALIAEVFGLDSRIGEPAPPGSAFVLPHAHAERRRSLRSGERLN